MCVTQEKWSHTRFILAPIVASFCFNICLAGAMVARLPTEQEVVGSSPTSGFETKRILLCLVVNGLERSDHLGVAGSTPALGFLSY